MTRNRRLHLEELRGAADLTKKLLQELKDKQGDAEEVARQEATLAGLEKEEAELLASQAGEQAMENFIEQKLALPSVADPLPPPPIVRPDGKLELSFEQLQQLMGEMAHQQNLGLLEAIKELRKPTEKELAAEAKQKADEERKLKAMIEAAELETKTREMLQNACIHRKPNGVMDYAGQVHNNGRVILICQICQKVLVNRMATADDYQQGPYELNQAPAFLQVM